MDSDPSHSYEQIYRQHRNALFALSVSIVGCEQAAEDAIHDAFVSICRKTYSPDEPVAYVFSAVRNSAIDITRRGAMARRASASIFNGKVAPEKDPESSYPDRLLDRERDLLLREAIDRLPGPLREILVLKCFGELTHEQVGSVLAIPTKTVATRYRRALARLKKTLKGKL